MSLYDIRNLIDSFRAVQRNTIQTAEEIPEAHHQYRPTPASRWSQKHWSILHGLRVAKFHARGETNSIPRSVRPGAFLALSEVEEMRTRLKAEIIEMLHTEGERWVQWVEQLPATFLSEAVRLPDGRAVSRFEMLLGTKEHEFEHRAQLSVIERLPGLVPHFTRNLPISRVKLLRLTHC